MTRTELEFEDHPPADETAGEVIPDRPAQVSYGFANRFGVLVTGRDEDGRHRVAHRPDLGREALLELRRCLDSGFRLQAVSTEAFNALLSEHYERDSSEAMEAVEDFSGDSSLSEVAEQLAEPEDLLEADDDAPIIRLINALLSEAIKEGASDIHVETFENRTVVRFRVDGMLREVLSPPRSVAPFLVSRIKVMAKLDIAEKRLPQDGRISLRVAGRAVDVRVSTLPSGHGERVVLRLLDKKAGRLDLEQLGLCQRDRHRLDELIHKPNGILLVTGPTGSGKTTTLYAALTRLNERVRNILTVEDPIEYYLDGIGQTQVNSKVDMTFARGLRAILRQDPDVVMVGEIRDLETAQIAVQASLTGHLVLSTLHTNSAVGAITRLRDMGVEPFLLASSLIGVLAQRLVRTLSTDCVEPYTPDASEQALLGHPEPTPAIYRPREDALCKDQGYKGRSGIYELVPIDSTMRTLIHDGAGEHALEQHARTLCPPLREDGIRRVLAGETSLEEVVRVTREE